MDKNCKDLSLFYSEIPKIFWTQLNIPFKRYFACNFH
jgi:hypothetical protein